MARGSKTTEEILGKLNDAFNKHLPIRYRDLPRKFYATTLFLSDSQSLSCARNRIFPMTVSTGLLKLYQSHVSTEVSVAALPVNLRKPINVSSSCWPGCIIYELSITYRGSWFGTLKWMKSRLHTSFRSHFIKEWVSSLATLFFNWIDEVAFWISHNPVPRVDKRLKSNSRKPSWQLPEKHS